MLSIQHISCNDRGVLIIFLNNCNFENYQKNAHFYPRVWPGRQFSNFFKFSPYLYETLRMIFWKYGVVIGLLHDSVIFSVTVLFANFVAILQFFKASVGPVHHVQNSWKFYQFFFSWGRTFLLKGRVDIKTFSKSWGVWCTLVFRHISE